MHLEAATAVGSWLKEQKAKEAPTTVISIWEKATNKSPRNRKMNKMIRSFSLCHVPVSQKAEMTSCINRIFGMILNGVLRVR